MKTEQPAIIQVGHFLEDGRKVKCKTRRLVKSVISNRWLLEVSYKHKSVECVGVILPEDFIPS